MLPLTRHSNCMTWCQQVLQFAQVSTHTGNPALPIPLLKASHEAYCSTERLPREYLGMKFQSEGKTASSATLPPRIVETNFVQWNFYAIEKHCGRTVDHWAAVNPKIPFLCRTKTPYAGELVHILAHDSQDIRSYRQHWRSSRMTLTQDPPNEHEKRTTFEYISVKSWLAPLMNKSFNELPFGVSPSGCKRWSVTFATPFDVLLRASVASTGACISTNIIV